MGNTLEAKLVSKNIMDYYVPLLIPIGGFLVTFGIFMPLMLGSLRWASRLLMQGGFMLAERVILTVLLSVSLYLLWLTRFVEPSTEDAFLLHFVAVFNICQVFAIYFFRAYQKVAMILHSLTTASVIAIPTSVAIIIIIYLAFSSTPALEEFLLGVFWGLVASYFLAFTIGSTRYLLLQSPLFGSFSISWFVTFAWFTSFYFVVLTVLGDIFSPGPREGFGYIMIGIVLGMPIFLVIAGLFGAVIRSTSRRKQISYSALQ